MRLPFGLLMARAWARSFMAHCKAAMSGTVPDAGSAATRIRGQAAALFREHELSLPDAQTKSWIATCCLVLAAYRELRGSLAAPIALRLIGRIVYRTYQRPMRFLTRAWLLLTRDPLKRLRGNWWKAQSQRVYGGGMKFDQEETEDSVDLIVRRCAFHEFFMKHGEPELTRVFCAWDRNWMDIVDASERSIRTERLAAISTGSSCCRFRLTRDEGRPPGEPADVVLAELHPRPTGCPH
jgi:hypothetical protein